MINRDKDTKKADEILKAEYPIIGTINTYFNNEGEELSNVEKEIRAMKEIEESKNKKQKNKKQND